MSPRYKFEVAISYGADDVKFMLEVIPWYLKPLRLVAYLFTPRFDVMWMVRNKIDTFIFKKTKRFYIPAQYENLKEFLNWAGWTSQVDWDDSE